MTQEQELEFYIQMKRKKDLRVKKYIFVLILTILAIYGLYLLGASIWEIIVMVITVEIAFIIADMEGKVNEEKDEKYKKEFFKKQAYLQRKRERMKKHSEKVTDSL
ncbi:hypothetical protein MNB_SM-3-476 [hydrothermal vent metagenome]|uniref:Uncharacterized protein n=1 Tax=hydrothermal vent metagenome TaxID=652676 RepID=A0A1W1D1Q9_9ZZZZ